MIAAGTQLGAYRVEGLLGEGGMGQVYRAIDTRLDRVVAIKVLPPHLSGQQSLRERFEREARVISALSHPNICTLFDVGRHDGADFLVMEHLEGETLADRLARGALPLEEVIRYGSEVASALAAAHRRGIVHRDLKPGNVMLTRSGAMLLDFGLAKPAVPAVSAADAPTEQRHPLTVEGTLLGTYQYMAPEQLEGREADARTDIFAFGALLFEMATGTRAFDGSSRASVIAAILERQPPPIASLQPAAPSALDRLIRACLAKRPDDRLQSAHDAMLQLQWIGENTDAGAAVRARRGYRSWVVPLLAVLLLIAAASHLVRRDAATHPTVHLALLPPPGFDMSEPAVSPRGELAFFARSGSEQALFVRNLGNARARQVAETRGYSPFWSPDGASIAYFNDGNIFKVAASGGAPERVASVGNAAGGGTWSSNDTIVFAHSSGTLYSVPASGGTPKQFTRLEPSRKEIAHGWPVALPADRGILFLAALTPGANRISHVPATGGESSEIMAADALVGYSEPYLLYVRQGDLFAVRFDTASLRISGEPRRVADQVRYDVTEGTAYSSVGASVLVFPSRDREKRRMVWYDRQGRSAGVALEDENITRPRLSPDGRRLLLTKFVAERGMRGVFSVDLARGTRTLLTPPSRTAFDPVWLPDGQRFVFTSLADPSDGGLFVQQNDPQSQPAVLWEGHATLKEAVNVTRDGRVVVREYQPATAYDLWLVPTDGGERVPLVATAGNEIWGDVSPDGRWLAYVSNAAGTSELYVRPLLGGRSEQVSTTGAVICHWSRDGSELFFNTPDKTLMRVRVSGTERLEIGPPERLFQFDRTAHYSYELSTDGKLFLVNELADPTSAVRSYNVSIGWKEALEQ